ncbi:TIR-like protein FxsC [Kitasatospora sp. NBC_01560]|uniref:TIR-like protein FxsC n=1 Tax=Kitasatospora sp. NBC_01560 TaxID=2975965 RepID=UPI0038700A10
MTSPLHRALEVARAAGIDLTADELLDILHLALRLPGGPGSPLLAALDAEAARGIGHGAAWRRHGSRPYTEADDRAEDQDDALEQRPALPLHSGVRADGADAGGDDWRPGGTAVRVPEGKALRDDLLLGRALRPLKRRRDGPDARELDEAATASAWADTGLPTLVLQPTREPWLRCTVVVDDGVSMLLWRRLVVELNQLLARIGGFRQLRVLGLRSRGPGDVRLRAKPFTDSGPLRMPDTVSDPTGGTLLLVVTDGAGSAWRDGRMRAVLDRWARCGPAAILHTLPRRMWAGSGVNAAPRTVRSPGPGSPNTAWILTSAPPGPRPAPIPVLELSPASLTDWARLVAVHGDEVTLALWEDEPPRPARTARRRRPAPADGAPALERFRRAASPGAHRLAAHLAAVAPLSVPVMRLVQSAVPDGEAGDPAALAEVFLGGLMRPVTPLGSAPDAPAEPVHHRRFDFPAEVKDALLESVPTAELLDVRRRVTGRLEQLAGRSPDFPAWLGGGAPAAPGVDGAPFAWAGVPLLDQLGGARAGEAGGPGANGVGRDGGGTAAAAPAEPGSQDRAGGHGAEPDRTTGPAGRATASVTPTATAPPAVPAAPAASGHRRPAERPADEDVLQPYFFLSYAHTPRSGTRGASDPNQWVRQLFRDLCESILQLTTVPAGTPVGFMDDSVEQGQPWSQQISQQLATCRVFVPLYSPRYFQSQICGQEWHTFTRRPVYATTVDAEPSSGIVPVLWAPTGHYRLPDVANELQFSHAGFGPDYSAEGMYALMKLSYFRPAYELAVHRLARRIVEVAEETVIPVGRLSDFLTQPSAFQASKPPRQLQIAVFSYHQGEVPAGRSSRWYGPRRIDWQPYRGLVGRSLADHAAVMARQLGFQPTVHELDETIGDLTGAALPPGPVVVLLDRWALLDPRRRELVRALDRTDPSWVSVLEPWSSDDPEAADGEAELHRLAGETIRYTGRSTRRAAGPESGQLSTLEAFDEALPQAVMRAHYAFGALDRSPAAGADRPQRPSLRETFRSSRPPEEDTPADPPR